MERKPLEDISRGHKRVRTPSPDLDPDEMNEEEEEQFGNYMEEYKRVFNLNRLGDERAEKRIYNRAKKAGINVNNTGDFLDWLEEQIEDRLGVNNVNTENNPPEQEGEGMFHKEIRELQKKLQGEGIIDTIKDVGNKVIDKGKDLYNKAKHIISTATKLNNTSRKTLEKFGNQKIKNIIATREVVQKAVTTLINLISGGHLDKEKNKMGYDDFFHIRLYCEMENGTYILLEKNEVVFIYPKGEIKGEKLPINYKENSITLNELVNKTIKYMGDKDFYTYDAFTNNCASFVIAILKANELWSEKDKAFLLQDVKHLKDKLPKTKQVASYITQLGAIVSRARGKGNKKFSGGMENNPYALTALIPHNTDNNDEEEEEENYDDEPTETGSLLDAIDDYTAIHNLEDTDEGFEEVRKELGLTQQQYNMIPENILAEKINNLLHIYFERHNLRPELDNEFQRRGIPTEIRELIRRFYQRSLQGQGIYNFGGINQELEIQTNQQGLPFTTGEEIELGTYNIRFRQLDVLALQPEKILLNIVGIFGENKQNQIITNYNSKHKKILVIQSASIEPAGQKIGSIFFNLLMKFFNNYIDKISNIEKIQLLYEGTAPQSLGFYIKNFAKYGFYLNGDKRNYTKEQIEKIHNQLPEKIIYFTRPQ